MGKNIKCTSCGFITDFNKAYYECPLCGCPDGVEIAEESITISCRTCRRDYMAEEKDAKCPYCSAVVNAELADKSN